MQRPPAKAQAKQADQDHQAEARGERPEEDRLWSDVGRAEALKRRQLFAGGKLATELQVRDLAKGRAEGHRRHALVGPAVPRDPVVVVRPQDDGYRDGQAHHVRPDRPDAHAPGANAEVVAHPQGVGKVRHEGHRRVQAEHGRQQADDDYPLRPERVSAQQAQQRPHRHPTRLDEEQPRLGADPRDAQKDDHHEEDEGGGECPVEAYGDDDGEHRRQRKNKPAASPGLVSGHAPAPAEGQRLLQQVRVIPPPHVGHDQGKGQVRPNAMPAHRPPSHVTRTHVHPVQDQHRRYRHEDHLRQAEAQRDVRGQEESKADYDRVDGRIQQSPTPRRSGYDRPLLPDRRQVELHGDLDHRVLVPLIQAVDHPDRQDDRQGDPEEAPAEDSADGAVALALDQRGGELGNRVPQALTPGPLAVHHQRKAA